VVVHKALGYGLRPVRVLGNALRFHQRPGFVPTPHERPMTDDYVVIYLDDILVYSLDLDSHKAHVRRGLDRLRSVQLYAKPEKCECRR
jgi:hypothetical protein